MSRIFKESIKRKFRTFKHLFYKSFGIFKRKEILRERYRYELAANCYS